MSDLDVDLFVIGGGSGGVRAARIAASHGARVMVAEEHRLGGTCVIRGCVPKKVLVYASHVRHEIEDALGFGWTIPPARFDWPSLIAAKDREIARLEAVYTDNIKKAGSRIVKARAVLKDAHTLRLSTGETVRANYILIATGGTPNLGKPIPGIEHAITSNDVFHLTQFPERIVIYGGGYIAVEFACIFSGLGADVTMVLRSEDILRGFDKDIRTHLHNAMEDAGVKIVPRCNLVGIERHGKELRAHLSNDMSVAADEVLVAIGRLPNTSGLGLESSGVALSTTNGGVVVNEFSQTSRPNIYAVGDVTQRINLTPVAIREGHAFADSVFGGRPRRVDYSDIPTAVFSWPQVGTVGLTEEEARSRFDVVDVYMVDFKPLKATISGRRSRNMMKLVVDGSTDRVLGCHIVAPEAAEIIQTVGVAIKMGATKTDFDSTFPVHPTSAEELVMLHTPVASYLRSDYVSDPNL